MQNADHTRACGARATEGGCSGRTYLKAIEVVDCEHCAPLILVRDEAEALRLAGSPVPHEVEIHNFAVPALDSMRVSYSFADHARVHGGQEHRHSLADAL